ncbi:hypothetical protein H4582DRAFT_2058509 [Lactarius indigo]|nr:hypothetical protein H4582DRAFT_2058509 [Lactarius indigo]
MSAQMQDDITPSAQDSMTNSESSITRPRCSLRLANTAPVPGPIQPLSRSTSLSQSEHSASSVPAPIIDRSKPVEAQLADSERENGELWSMIANLIAMNSSLQTHCYYAGQTIMQQQQLLNAKVGKKNSQCRTERPLNGSTVLTSEEGHDRIKQLREEAKLKEQKAAEELARKTSEDEARRKRRADYTRVFAGPLNKSRRKEDLEDIAIALALPEGGKKDELIERITNHFEKHPALKTDPRFEGLFGSRPQKRARIDNGIVAGPSSTPGLTIPPGFPPPYPPPNFWNIPGTLFSAQPFPPYSQQHIE